MRDGPVERENSVLPPHVFSPDVSMKLFNASHSDDTWQWSMCIRVLSEFQKSLRNYGGWFLLLGKEPAKFAQEEPAVLGRSVI